MVINMRRSRGFLLKKIEDTYYLFPYGQKIAEQKLGMKLNDSGAFIWEHTKDEISLEKLQEIFCNYYEIEGKERESAIADVEKYVNSLIDQNVIVESRSDKHCRLCVNIGNIKLLLLSAKNCFPKELIPFQCEDDGKEDYKIFLTEKKSDELVSGTMLIRNREVIIVEQKEKLFMYFPMMKRVNELHFNICNNEILINIRQPFDASFYEELLQVIRMAYLYIASKKQMYAIHSASLLYKGKAWLFSGCSGTGKSTHTNLWKENFNTTIINGDLNLIANKGNEVVIKGTPWCGTSEIYDTSVYPLGGIILLKQSKDNYVKQISTSEKILYVSQRIISPFWTQNLFESGIKFIENITKDIMVCQLFCTKELSAAECMRDYIDRYLDQNN